MSEGQKGNGKAVTTATEMNAKLYKYLCFNKTAKRNAALGVTFVLAKVTKTALGLQMIYYYSDDAC